MSENLQSFSIVIPAKNEGNSLSKLLPTLKKSYAEAELIVVDDGSTDDTKVVCESAQVRVISHPYSKGNGAAIKTGARAATSRIIVFMDADGQHHPEDLSNLLKKMAEGYDLVIGARAGRTGQANMMRWGANLTYNLLASWMVGHRVADLTSGMRAVRRDLFLQVLPLLPNGFSYPTTTTMAFYRAGHSVAYVPIKVSKRSKDSRSHIRLFRDGGRFFIIIFRVATLYSPLKLFVPLSIFFLMVGSLYFTYTKLTTGHFTNFGGVLFTTAVLVFLIGLVSEQITALIHINASRDSEN